LEHGILGVYRASNFIMGHREIGWEEVVWMHLAQDRDQLRAFVNTAMNLEVP
jgi:hypothetical protein